MSTQGAGQERDYREALSLEGRSVAVVGAGQGMGHESARAAASMGARVVCIDRDLELARKVAEEVSGIAIAADVTDREAVRAAFAQVMDEYGSLHAVIDVVGAAEWHDVLETTDELLERAFALNYRQALYVLEEAAPLIRLSGGGAFALVSSVSGVRGAQRHSAYGSAKAALISLVRSAAVELAPHGIRVNAVAPGVILTPRTREGLFQDGDFVRNQASNVPLGRFGETSDISGMLTFLVSPASAYVTGQNIIVDGGVDAKFPHMIKE